MIEEQICPVCQKVFLPNRWWQKYCSRECNSLNYYLNKARKSGIDRLADDLEPPTSPSDIQQAEWDRRKKMSDERYKNEQEERTAHSRKLAEKAEEIIKNTSLEQLGYGTKKEGDS